MRLSPERDGVLPNGPSSSARASCGPRQRYHPCDDRVFWLRCRHPRHRFVRVDVPNERALRLRFGLDLRVRDRHGVSGLSASHLCERLFRQKLKAR